MIGDDIVLIRHNLNKIINGMRDKENNRCWPSVKSWTKKERDEAVLELAVSARNVLDRNIANLAQFAKELDEKK